MPAFVRFCNDNHHYIIAAIIIAAIGLWTFGCESQVSSIIDPEKLISRDELQIELDYLIGQATIKFAALDKQDAIKQQLLDAANVISQSGQINPSGLLNIAATIVAISFGLNRAQKLKNATNGSDKT